MDSVKMESFLIPLIDIAVPAGFPSPAADYLEDRINLNNFLIQHPEATFIVKCSGDSMIQAFIPRLCYLVVDKSITAENGDIVIASINGEFTVKYLRKNDYKCWLVPANPKYPELAITPEMDMRIWGVVTSIVINPKELRNAGVS